MFIRNKFPWIHCPKDWTGILTIMQNYRPQRFCYPVVWNFLEDGWLKYNTDGTCRRNLGHSSYAFCIRNSLGNLIYAEAKVLGEVTNMQAKTRVVLHALRYCSSNGRDKIIVETDSMALLKIIHREWRILWSIKEDIEEIHKISAKMTIRVTHSYREANQLADAMANLALDGDGELRYLAFQDMPSLCRKILNMDKHQIPSFKD